MEESDYPDKYLVPAPVVRGYLHEGLGIGSVIRLDDLEPTQHDRLATLVHVGSATVIHAMRGLVVEEAEWEKVFLVDWPIGAKHRLVQRHAVWPAAASVTIDIIGPASGVSQWDAPSKIKATYVGWFAGKQKEKEPGVDTQRHQLVRHEAQTYSEESSWNQPPLSYLVAIRNTMKLMALILWNSLRHPLTESVIDFDRVAVYNKPIDTQKQ